MLLCYAVGTAEFLCVQENLRQLCVFKLASEAGQSYRWWEYVTKFGEECTMAGKKYNSECAERVCTTCEAMPFDTYWDILSFSCTLLRQAAEQVLPFSFDMLLVFIRLTTREADM